MRDILRISPELLLGGSPVLARMLRSELAPGELTVVVDAAMGPGTMRIEQDGEIKAFAANIAESDVPT